MKSDTWLEQLSQTQARQHRVNVFVNFSLTTILVISTAISGLILEMIIEAKFDLPFFIACIFAAISFVALFFTWKLRESLGRKNGVLVHASINQVGTTGWEHDRFPKEYVRAFAPISRPYRVPSIREAAPKKTFVGEQLSSLASRIEEISCDHHGSALTLMAVGHFPAMFGIGYRANLPEGTVIIEHVKMHSNVTGAAKSSKVSRRSKDKFLEAKVGEKLRPGSPFDGQKLAINVHRKRVQEMDCESVRSVWCEIGLVQDRSLLGWATWLRELQLNDRSNADVTIRVGNIRQSPDESAEISDGEFSPIKIVSDASNGEAASNLSVTAAADLVTFTVEEALSMYPNAQIHVVARLPRSVAVIAGHRFSLRSTGTRYPGGPIDMDPWDRITLWGPKYAAGKGGKSYIEDLIPFDIINDI